MSLLCRTRMSLIIILLALPLMVAAQSGPAQGTVAASPLITTSPCNPNNSDLVENKIAILREVRQIFDKLGSEPIPRMASNFAGQQANKFSFWLRDSSEDIGRLLSYGEQFLQMCDWVTTTGQGDAHLESLHLMIASFSLNYLLLQQRLQQENRQFTTLAGIMKARLTATQSAIATIR
ncbi:MAG: hypothetical protein ACE5H7_02485 [Acidiferrobacterales bacterium]